MLIYKRNAVVLQCTFFFFLTIKKTPGILVEGDCYWLFLCCFFFLLLNSFASDSNFVTALSS